MNISNYVRIMVLIISVVGTCYALADDDNEHGSDTNKGSKRSVAAVADPRYKEECSSCHMLYPPGLLPARSWQSMMLRLNDHFGESAMVDKATQEYLTNFLSVNAADRSALRRSQKIARSIANNDSPLRFTETQYFKRQHHEIGANVWKRKAIGSPANCTACHSNAESGDFSEHAVRIPK